MHYLLVKLSSSTTVVFVIFGSAKRMNLDRTGSSATAYLVSKRRLPNLLLMELIEGYSCDKCGRKYKGKGSLRRHQKYECQMPPIFKCPYCPKRCKQKSNLKLHVHVMHASSFS
ncbi:unnamed protein product [Acanthoscelides obtectus]|uniref:C2H2-type domain-containing protein n=1 Tax=Acanthoscelides obtectus TaxID=200917 RepID=A0A9P0NYK9_ACAOB|nr:unnamed protein product [Acanthoscelides obtectus]CAK1669693.1 Longitudinals lacking protein, isoforms A/B/D/L [Acanthoscelides obtectus]